MRKRFYLNKNGQVVYPRMIHSQELNYQNIPENMVTTKLPLGNLRNPEALKCADLTV